MDEATKLLRELCDANEPAPDTATMADFAAYVTRINRAWIAARAHLAAQECVLRNANGVTITEGDKSYGHHKAVGALCECGEDLIVAPTVFSADHKKGDPVMICCDHGVHAYRFKELVLGRQPSGSAA